MNEVELGELLLSLSFIFMLTYTFGHLLSKFRIPSILAALFVGMALSYTPFSAFVHSITAFESTFTFLADLGVLFLLFYIGLQIELGEMKKSSADIIWLTALNTLFPFLFGAAAMLLYGYGWAVALVIGMTRMPTDSESAFLDTNVFASARCVPCASRTSTPNGCNCGFRMRRPDSATHG